MQVKKGINTPFAKEKSEFYLKDYNTFLNMYVFFDK